MSDIDIVAQKRAENQNRLDHRNKLKYSQFREQPQEHPKVQKADQFGQRPHKSLINLDGDST